MRKLLLSLLFISICRFVFAQTITGYNKQELMIPMRDGVKLYTVVFTPKEKTVALPILIQRTPYGAAVPEGFDIMNNLYVSDMAKEGYIFVVQDIRGKYKSEGTMQIHQPLIHANKKER